MTQISNYPASNRGSNITAWILQILLTLAFFAAAGAKLASVQMMVDDFQQIGLGQAFRYVTAIVEIIGAIALLAPRVSALGALWLAATMFGATMAHLFRLHTSPAPALVLFALCLVVAWVRRDQVAHLLEHLRGSRT
ncbi:DoxX family protein (plasmid) [Rhizobium sp. CB3171]|uniref:DoxX family protein n=1 Tax=Rhizobium sp. CB3171 TaxID=3039157 RepID=UPI0024B1FBA6|nr:DoxX family protein [Rhizobium sp. CB3171]WFU04633.1 DoxX family protein [Rhizobium sp. CB3171]